MANNPFLTPRTPAELAQFYAKLRNMGDTERFRRLDRSWQYYAGTQHLHKNRDWDGREVLAGHADWLHATVGTNRYAGSDDVEKGLYVPLKHRRPNAIFPLARIIVDRLTAMLYGEGRWPAVHVDGDSATEDYVRAIAEASKLRDVMLLARAVGGATGGAGLSYKLAYGVPQVEVHETKHLAVREWADRGRQVPAHVVKQYKVAVEEIRDGKPTTVQYWYRREWTRTAEVVYELEPVGEGETPEFRPRDVAEHGLGFCPFVWVQNRPGLDDEDGTSDFDGLWDLFDQTDLLFSAINKGTVLNVDPTLVLKMSRDEVKGGVRKGSDNAIVPGKDGDAHYLEISGTSISAGLSVFERMVRVTLDTAQVILVDPEKVSGAAQSAKAIEFLYAPMLANVDVLRTQWGEAIRRTLEGLYEMCVAMHGKPTVVRDPETGVEKPAKFGVLLPPRVEKGEDGQTVVIERVPGNGGEIRLAWGPYFPPTLNDTQTALDVASRATGGGQLFSEETMRAWAGRFVGVTDTSHEEARIEAERAKRPGLPPEGFAGGEVPAPQNGALAGAALQAAMDAAAADGEDGE